MSLTSVGKKEFLELIVRLSIELWRIHTDLLCLHYEFQLSHVRTFEAAKVRNFSDPPKKTSLFC